MITPAHRIGLAMLLGVGVACGAVAGSEPPPSDCGPTAIVCGGHCVDALVDPSNCGACGATCKSGELCANGRCSVACFGGTTRCGDACVDVHTNPSNCGACGNACSAGLACWNGGCVDACPSAQTVCKGFCVDTETDPLNCGACDGVCQSKQKCSGGKCVCAGEICDSACTDLQTDSRHCGACGVGCIPEVEACVAGKCVCASGLTSCGGNCVDLASSSNNCGTCGKTCASGELCTDGTCGAPTTDWPTQGADAARDGVLVGEIGKPPLRPAWTSKLVGSGGAQPIVVAKNHVIVTFPNSYFPKNTMYSLDLADGSVQWSYLIGDAARTGYPSVDGGRVYLVNPSGNSVGPRAMAVDAATGSLVWSTPVGYSMTQYWSPLLVGGKMYTSSAVGQFAGFDASAGTFLFSENLLDQHEDWSCTWSGSEVLTFVGSQLRAHDPVSGVTTWSTTVPTTVIGYSMLGYPAVANGMAFVVARPTLYAISLTTHAIVWSAPTTYTGAPAVYGGAVFAVGGGTLIVRDAANGQLLWNFVGDGKLRGAPVIANGHVYVSSDDNTYALDIATQSQVWTVPLGGTLSIASQRLIIAAKDAVRAFLMSK